jgi:hypothetical protein
MSTEINETRTDQDPERESAEQYEQAEKTWASDAAGTTPRESAAERTETEREEDERDEDEAYPGETRFGQDAGQDGSAPAYLTSDDVEAEQPVPGAGYTDESEFERDGDAAADADEFPAFGELTSETGAPEIDEVEQPLAADDAVDADADTDLPLSTSLESSEGFEGAETSVGSADSAELEGVPRPENLGGHNLDAEGEPLVGADAQQEFLSRWTQIQISFLEDPTGAVESADALIQEIGAAVVASLEERGRELAAGGRAATDTEQQRLALRQYRAYIGALLPQ